MYIHCYTTVFLLFKPHMAEAIQLRPPQVSRWSVGCSFLLSLSLFLTQHKTARRSDSIHNTAQRNLNPAKDETGASAQQHLPFSISLSRRRNARQILRRRLPICAWFVQTSVFPFADQLWFWPNTAGSESLDRVGGGGRLCEVAEGWRAAVSDWNRQRRWEKKTKKRKWQTAGQTQSARLSLCWCVKAKQGETWTQETIHSSPQNNSPQYTHSHIMTTVEICLKLCQQNMDHLQLLYPVIDWATETELCNTTCSPPSTFPGCWHFSVLLMIRTENYWPTLSLKDGLAAVAPDALLPTIWVMCWAHAVHFIHRLNDALLLAVIYCSTFSV